MIKKDDCRGTELNLISAEVNTEAQDMSYDIALYNILQRYQFVHDYIKELLNNASS